MDMDNDLQVCMHMHKHMGKDLHMDKLHRLEVRETIPVCMAVRKLRDHSEITAAHEGTQSRGGESRGTRWQRRGGRVLEGAWSSCGG